MFGDVRIRWRFRNIFSLEIFSQHFVQVGEELGSGNFAKTCKGIIIESGREVAIKIPKEGYVSFIVRLFNKFANITCKKA